MLSIEEVRAIISMMSKYTASFQTLKDTLSRFLTDDERNVFLLSCSSLGSQDGKLLSNGRAEHAEDLRQFSVGYNCNDVSNGLCNLPKIQSLQLLGDVHKEPVKLVQVVQQMLKAENKKQDKGKICVR